MVEKFDMQEKLTNNDQQQLMSLPQQFKGTTRMFCSELIKKTSQMRSK